MPAISWTLRFVNNATARLFASITDSTTSIQLAAGQGARFPTLGANEYFVLTLEDPEAGKVEVVNVIARVGDLLTVERGQEGTTPYAFQSPSTYVSARVTKGMLEKFLQRTS